MIGGVLGHVLAYAACVEGQARKTFHMHVIIGAHRVEIFCSGSPIEAFPAVSRAAFNERFFGHLTVAFSIGSSK